MDDINENCTVCEGMGKHSFRDYYMGAFVLLGLITLFAGGALVLALYVHWGLVLAWVPIVGPAAFATFSVLTDRAEQ